MPALPGRRDWLRPGHSSRLRLPSTVQLHGTEREHRGKLTECCKIRDLLQGLAHMGRGQKPVEGCGLCAVWAPKLAAKAVGEDRWTSKSGEQGKLNQ